MKLFTIFIFLIFFYGATAMSGSTEKSAFSVINEDPLTEKEQKESENYVHQGLADKKFNELCENGQGDFKDICDGGKEAFKSGSSFSKIEKFIPIVDKAMAVIGLGAEFTVTNPGTDGNPVETKEPDYCAKIAIISEVASTVLVKSEGDVAEDNFRGTKPEARQAATFRALAANQKSMKKASNIQFGVWSATAVCYTAYVAQAQYRGDWKAIAKLAGATLMATFYKMKADAHGDRQKLLLKMAKQLPQAGECSPTGDKLCFCEEESSFQSDPANFNKICVPQALASRNQQNNASICLNQNGKADPECQCKKTKTCIDRRLKIAGVNLGLSPTELRNPLEALKPLSEGFGAGNLSAANKNLNLANKALKNFNPESHTTLNPKQKELAKSLFENGIPKAAAAVFAKNASSASSGSTPFSATAALSSDGGFERRFSVNSNNAFETPRFKQGGGASSNRKNSSYTSPYGRKGSKNNSKNAIQIEELANEATQKAIREAEVVSDTSKGIFEIISYRYKLKAKRPQNENVEWGL